MEAMKPYFEFIVMYIVCGIPEITLEGTPEDWEKVLDKARRLKVSVSIKLLPVWLLIWLVN